MPHAPHDVLLERERKLADRALAPRAADAPRRGRRRAAGRCARRGGCRAAPRLRAWCIDLGVRAAHASVTASSGSANFLENPAQRLFREAMVYTVIAQTGDLQAALFERQVRSEQTAWR